MKKITPKKRGARAEAKRLVEQAQLDELRKNELVEKCLDLQDELAKTKRSEAQQYGRLSRENKALVADLAAAKQTGKAAVRAEVARVQAQMSTKMREKDMEIATLRAAVDEIRTAAAQDSGRIVNMLRKYHRDLASFGVRLTFDNEQVRCTKAGVTVSLSHDSVLYHGVNRLVKMFEQLSPTPATAPAIANSLSAIAADFTKRVVDQVVDQVVGTVEANSKRVDEAVEDAARKETAERNRLPA